MTTFQELADIRREFVAKMQAEGETIIKDYFNEIFAEYPEIQAVAWRAYVPSFNDGDPCEFSISGPFFSVDGLDPKYSEWDEDYDEDDEESPIELRFCDTYSFYDKVIWHDSKPDSVPETSLLEKYDNPYNKDENRWREWTDVHPLYQTVLSIIDTFNQNEEVIEQVFGSNHECIVTRDKITINEYECGY